MRRSLEEWGARHERIIFRSGVDLLQTLDAEMMEALRQTPEIARQIDHMLLPTVALIQNGEMKKLTAALRQHGHLSAVSRITPEAANRSISVADDGTIRALHPLPHLYTKGRLARMAEGGEDGIWRLTAESVIRRGGSRSKVQAMIEDLTALNHKPLPVSVVRQIKAWGNYYGNAHMGKVTLIEFQSKPILEELLTHPEVAEHLTPFAAGERALAVVNGDMRTVKKILDQFGIATKAGF